jgi:hypothetical protein
MKKVVLAFLLMGSALVCWAGTEPNPADYNVTVHVKSSHLDGRGLIWLNVLIDGKNYELLAIDAENSLLTPGDYKAKTVAVKVKDVHTYDVHGQYEFLFPDKKVRRYDLAGVTE